MEELFGEGDFADSHTFSDLFPPRLLRSGYIKPFSTAQWKNVWASSGKLSQIRGRLAGRPAGRLLAQKEAPQNIKKALGS